MLNNIKYNMQIKSNSYSINQKDVKIDALNSSKYNEKAHSIIFKSYLIHEKGRKIDKANKKIIRRIIENIRRMRKKKY